MKTYFSWSNGTLQATQRTSAESSETVQRLSPVQIVDDFVGSSLLSIAEFSTASTQNWKKSTIGAGAVAAKADAVAGVVECALTSASAEQLACLNRVNQRNLDVTKKLVTEFRFRFTVLPTSGTKFFIGLAADHNKTAQSITELIGFSADGSALLYADADDATTDSQVTTATTLVLNTWYIGRIECYDVTSLKYYLNGAQVASGSTIPFAATGANAVLQEYASLYKASGTSVGTVEVDYFKTFFERA